MQFHEYLLRAGEFYFRESALWPSRRWRGTRPADFIALVEKHGIPYHEKTLGQLFCDRSATDTLRKCSKRNAGHVGSANICEQQNPGRSPRWRICGIHRFGGVSRAPSLVVATGGLSISQNGGDSFWIRFGPDEFGLNICRKRSPRLCRSCLRRRTAASYCELAGVSADVIAGADLHSFREKMLITHRGFSGPAILQISSYWQAGETIRIDLAPDRKALARRFMNQSMRNMAAARSAFEKVLAKRLRRALARIACSIIVVESCYRRT